MADRWRLGVVTAIGLLLAVGFGWFAFLGKTYAYGTPVPQRPMVQLTVLLFVLSILSLGAVFAAIKIESRQRTLRQIVILLAVCYRLTLLFSPPFLEIDLYRYMWDGIVLKNGLSPYRFSPQDALAAETPASDPRRAVVELAGSTEAIHTIVSRIHYPELTTIYPPVSQIVFAISMAAAPDQSSVETHLTAMKTPITLFDLGTLVILIGLLHRARLHVGWLIVYAWNPLILKEFANSGHLDSIAVFFTTAAVYAVVRAVQPDGDDSRRDRAAACWALVGTAMLSLGVGAKLFPIILLPLLATVVLKWLGWRAAAAFCLLTVLMSAAILYPMLRETARNHVGSRVAQSSQPNDKTQKNRHDGLSSFLARWQMNDLLFRVVYENVNHRVPQKLDRPWYLVTSDSFRHRLADQAKESGWALDHRFTIARAATLVLFLAIYCVLLCRILFRGGRLGRLKSACESDPEWRKLILQSTFLVIAAFFFTQPTQNPWYWSWALPFVCFHPNRGWLAVAPALLVYYLRFWIRDLDMEFAFGPFTYSRSRYFDHCVVWFEYAPVFALVIAFWVRAKWGRGAKKITPRPEGRGVSPIPKS